jgi:phenylpropionate dioxygenase-like ring-hydroxylating dioxygenase large terminal subunit
VYTDPLLYKQEIRGVFERAWMPHKYGYQGNWKFQAENGVDGYHAGFVQESALSTFVPFGIGRYAQRPPIPRLTRGGFLKMR